MKISDFAPRTGAIEAHLRGTDLTGIEIGADVGAHAESMLTHCSIKELYLVDIWENSYCFGYCEGRLARWRNKINLIQSKSADISDKFSDQFFDFIYLDQQHDFISVNEDFKLWWPKLKKGGAMSLRNYSEANKGLKTVADQFSAGKVVEIDKYHNEIIIFK